MARKYSKKLINITWTGMTKKKSDMLFVFFMLLFPILHFLVFWVYVNFDSIALAFEHEVTGQWGFSNFDRFFRQLATDWESDSGIKVAIENTLITGTISMFWTFPTTLIVTYLLFKQFYGHMFMRIAYYIPAIMGTAVTMVLAKYTAGPYGPYVQVGSLLGIPWSEEILQSGLYNNWGSARIAFHVTDMLGVSGAAVLYYTGALLRIPKDIFDAGKIDGVGMFRELFLVCLPCIWSTVGIQWVMTFSSVWGSYQRVMMLTDGGYGTNNFAYYMFSNTLSAVQGGGSYNYAAALGLILTVVVAPLTLLLRWASNKVVQPVEF